MSAVFGLSLHRNVQSQFEAPLDSQQLGQILRVSKNAVRYLNTMLLDIHW